jgi:hypothetical protein
LISLVLPHGEFQGNFFGNADPVLSDRYSWIHPFIILIRKREGRILCRKSDYHFSRADGYVSLSRPVYPQLFGLDIASFAVAGAIVIFIVAMEMILGITLIKDDPNAKGSGSAPLCHLAFPLIAGAGTLTTILSLRAVYRRMEYPHRHRFKPDHYLYRSSFQRLA